MYANVIQNRSKFNKVYGIMKVLLRKKIIVFYKNCTDTNNSYFLIGDKFHKSTAKLLLEFHYLELRFGRIQAKCSY
jgi:hypothetical protein